MDSHEFGAFIDWFNVLAVTHRLNATEDQRGKMQAEYFDVLRPYPFDAVRQSYESLRRKMKKWPVPADWLEALPPFGSTARLPPLTAEELAENEEAERMGYEAPTVCTCRECQDADCFLPPRYVPKLDRQGQVIERRHPDRAGRPVLLGRWIHGAELKRWYAARANYKLLKDKFDAELKAAKTLPVSERIERLTRTAAVIAVAPE